MTRSVPVAVLLVVLAAGGVAHADDTMPTGPLASGARITFSELKIHQNNNPSLDFPKVDPDSIWHYFNLAHCQCSQAKPGGFNEGSFAYLLKLEGANGAAVGRPLEVYVGSNCMPDAARPPSTTATCHRIDSAGLASVDSLVSPGNFRPEIPIFDFMTPAPGATACVPAEQTSTLWAAVDTNANGLLDYFASQPLTTDSLAPPLPLTGSFRASGVDSGIQISWTPPSVTSDVFAYQALCARADNDSPGKTSGQPSQRYMTATTLCGLPQSLTLMPIDIPADPNAPDAGAAVTLPDGMANLDPMFLCDEVTSATVNSLRIGGLQNGVAYKVALLVEDKYQNVNGVYFTSTVTPVPSVDFWQDLHDRGSKTEGGFCLLAETYGNDSTLTGALRAFRDDTLGASRAGRWLVRAYYATLARLGVYVHGSIALRIAAAILLAPAVALALLWHWLTLYGLLGLIAAAVVWRRRRAALVRRAVRLLRPRAAASAIALVIAGVAGRAHADGGGYRPYWADNDSLDQTRPAADAGAEDVAWHVGVRIGPYVPQVDAQLGTTSPGPYQQMFGSSLHLLTMLDVDRIVWSGFGQVAVGLSAGYFQNTAHTFAIGTSPMDHLRHKAVDTNTFRLVPTELSATYRFTWLDDNYGVPVVPYVRGGLGYYLWWINGANGLANACGNSSMVQFCKDPSHDKRALGATAGVQGAIGLAIRAERIDASTAMSMQQSGIQHAGIYAELSDARIHGFGSDRKLSVGDLTWFAGVDFEF